MNRYFLSKGFFCLHFSKRNSFPVPMGSWCSLENEWKVLKNVMLKIFINHFKNQNNRCGQGDGKHHPKEFDRETAPWGY